MSKYSDYYQNKLRQFGEKFDDSDLNASFIKYFDNQERINVSFRTKEGKEYEQKRGRIGITTGWKPVFLLMLTIRSHGSSYTIGKHDIPILTHETKKPLTEAQQVKNEGRY